MQFSRIAFASLLALTSAAPTKRQATNLDPAYVYHDTILHILSDTF